jgi:hypothetical protein
VKAPVWTAIIAGAAFEITALILGIYAWKYNRAKVVVMLVLALCLYSIVIGRQNLRPEPAAGSAAPSGNDGADPRF